MPMQSPPPPDSFDLIKWTWTVLMVPLGWVMHRHSETRQDIITIRRDLKKAGEALAKMDAHAEHTKDDIFRIGNTLDRMADRMENRRRGDSE